MLLLTACGMTGEPVAEEPAPEEPPQQQIPQGCSDRGDHMLCRDIEYARYSVDGESRSLLLDLYRPTQVGFPPYPLLIYIHGGGWMEGDKSNCPAQIPVRRGYAVACINYRLSDEAIFPAQIHDVKAAVRWLRAHADLYILDTDRFGAWGDSAGGHLSALLGTSAGVPELEGEGPHLEESSAVQAVCDWYGPTDFFAVRPAFTESVDRADAALFDRYGDRPWFEYTLATTLLLGGPAVERDDLARMANPITHVDPDDPPFLIVHGESDSIVPPTQSNLLADALMMNNVEVAFIVEPELGHSFDRRMIVRALDFFEWHLMLGSISPGEE
jgi:acetyl esterase/lipase